MALTYLDLNAYTTNTIVPVATEVIFKNDPVFSMLKARKKVFPGGLQLQKPLTIAELNGDFFGRGENFDTGYKITDTAMQITMKFAQVNISLFGVDNVFNTGPASAFSIVETKFNNASLTMAKLLATNMYRDGQGALSGPKSFDGLAAWIDDGSTNATYTGATNYTRSFAAVGGITRADIATSPSAGDESAYANVSGLNAYTHRNVTGFTLPDLNRAYQFAWFGNEAPETLVGTQGAYTRVWNATVPNQRYVDQNSTLAKIGFQTFRFNASEFVFSKYFHDVVTAGGANLGAILGLNTKYVEMHVSNNPAFAFGFTGFKESVGNIDVSGQFIFAGNFMVTNPRSCFKMVGSGLTL